MVAASKGKGFLLEPRIVVCFSPPNEKSYIYMCALLSLNSAELLNLFGGVSPKSSLSFCAVYNL